MKGLSNKKHKGRSLNVKWSVKKVFCLIFIVVFCSFLSVGCNSIKVDESGGISYDVCASYDYDNHILNGEVGVDYVYQGEATVTSLPFYLHPNRYGEGLLEIVSVHIDGTQVGFSVVDDIYMEVALPYELFSGDKVSLVINWKVQVLEGDGIFGYTVDEVRLSGWYPVLLTYDGEWQKEEGKWGDYLFSSCADYTVRLTLGEELIVASSGKRLSTTNSNGNVTYTYKGENMRDFAFSISPSYKVVSGVCGGTLISAYAYSDSVAQEVLSYAQRALSYYNQNYGDYPYPTYSVCVTKIKEGGMEFSGIVYVNEQLEGVELEEVVAHETAHQWWYGLVGSSPVTHAWLDEGLTEYSTYKYLSHVYGDEVYQKKVQSAYKAYSALLDVEVRLGGKSDIPLSVTNSKYRSTYEYVMVTYVKGALFFDNLNAITFGKFDLALRDYCSQFSYTIVTPEDLRLVVEEKSKLNLLGVFDAWESGKVVFCF